MKRSSGGSGGSLLGLIPLGFGVLAAGAGTFCLLQAKDRHDQFVDPKGPRLDALTQQRLAGEGGTYQSAGLVAIGVGAAAVVAGGAMLLFMSGSSGRASLIAVPSADGVLVGLGGTFE